VLCVSSRTGSAACTGQPRKVRYATSAFGCRGHPPAVERAGPVYKVLWLPCGEKRLRDSPDARRELMRRGERNTSRIPEEMKRGGGGGGKLRIYRGQRQRRPPPPPPLVRAGKSTLAIRSNQCEQTGPAQIAHKRYSCNK